MSVLPPCFFPFSSPHFQIGLNTRIIATHTTAQSTSTKNHLLSLKILIPASTFFDCNIGADTAQYQDSYRPAKLQSVFNRTTETCDADDVTHECDTPKNLIQFHCLFLSSREWVLQDSNLRSDAYEASALPTELRTLLEPRRLTGAFLAYIFVFPVSKSKMYTSISWLSCFHSGINTMASITR